MLTDTVSHLKSRVHESAVGNWPWLERQVAELITLLFSPLTGVKTHYPWLQMLEMLVLALIVFAAARGALGVGVLGFLRYCFPKALYNHPSSWTDYKLNLANYFTGSSFNITWRLNQPLMTGYALAVMASLFGARAEHTEWTMPAILFFTILMWVADDLGYYLFHYASHKVKFLWAFHKVHHSAELLTPFTAGRVHPMEYAFSAPTRAATTAIVLGPAFYLYGSEPTVGTFYGMTLFMIVSGALGEQLLHSHVWLSWGPFWEKFILSPAQHQVHHSSAPQHWDRNFAGRFSLWDWIFGTIYITHGPEKITYGIHGEPTQPHRGVIEAYLRPYWEIVPMKRWMIGLGGTILGAWLPRLADRWRLLPPPRPNG